MVQRSCTTSATAIFYVVMIGSILGLARTACAGAKEYVDCFGTARGLAFLPLARPSTHSTPREARMASIPGHKGFVLVRPGTTDIEVFNTTYITKQYSFDFTPAPKVIVDAGAYTGLSTAYFASTYPDATVVAIEPDSTNFDMLVRNTSTFENVRTIQAALWSTNESVELIDPGAGAWAFRIEETGGRGRDELRSGVPERIRVAAVTVSDIIRKYDLPYIDLLKLDIEGSEKEVLASSAPWIAHVGAICIELHDRFKPGCSREFYNAVTDFPVEYRRGETILVTRAQ